MPLPFLFLLLLFPVNGMGDDAIKDAGTYLKSKVVTRTLPNGITVILLNRGYSPTLAFEIAFRVGSVDESYRCIGAAHMLEHMLFKGTDRLGTKNFQKEKKILRRIEAVGETLDYLRLTSPKNERIAALEKELARLQKKAAGYVISSPYDRIYTRSGGVGFNASTSRDKTGYYIELPADKLDIWARIESERLKRPVLREYYLERNNVIQERLMRYDSQGQGLLFEQYMATAFAAHPYRHPIIGWRSNIPYLSLKDIRHFFRTYYTPQRMTITIVGKQDIEKTWKVLKKYFSNIPRGRDLPEIPVEEPKQRGEKRVVVKFESNPWLLVGWHKPTYPSHDDYVFDIISEVLAGSKNSLLYRRLVLEKKLAADVSAWNGAPGARYDNMFIIFITPRRGKDPALIEKEVYSVVASLAAKVPQKELERARVKMESELVFGLDSNKGIAHLLSYYQTVFKDWRYAADYLDAISRVKAADITGAIKKYMIPENRVVGILKDSRGVKK